jgi:hypothetical protein
MVKKISNRLDGISFACLMLLSGLFGCTATTPTVTDQLDWQTGATVTFVNTPLMLYRENPGKAAYARDYAHLGPIRVNRSGTYQYYLWVGSWATMQKSNVSEHRDGFESIVIFADEEPLLLELSGWTPDAIGISKPTYIKPVASSTDAYYQVTIDQIRLIAEASDIRLHSTGSSPKDFELWDAQKSARNELTEFLATVFP